MDLETKIGKSNHKIRKIAYVAIASLSLATTGCPVGYSGFYSSYPTYRVYHVRERPFALRFFGNHLNLRHKR
jgi:hypothetical protein